MSNISIKQVFSFVSFKMDAIKTIVNEIDLKTNEIKALNEKLAQEIDKLKKTQNKESIKEPINQGFKSSDASGTPQM